MLKTPIGPRSPRYRDSFVECVPKWVWKNQKEIQTMAGVIQIQEGVLQSVDRNSTPWLGHWLRMYMTIRA